MLQLINGNVKVISNVWQDFSRPVVCTLLFTFLYSTSKQANKATDISLLGYLAVLISHATLILQFTAACCDPCGEEASVEVDGGLAKW